MTVFSEIFFSETIQWIEMKLCSFIIHILRYTKIFFIETFNTKWRLGIRSMVVVTFLRSEFACSI